MMEKACWQSRGEARRLKLAACGDLPAVLAGELRWARSLIEHLVHTRTQEMVNQGLAQDLGIRGLKNRK